MVEELCFLGGGDDSFFEHLSYNHVHMVDVALLTSTGHPVWRKTTVEWARGGHVSKVDTSRLMVTRFRS